VTSDLPEPALPALAAVDLKVQAAVHDANQLLWVIQGQATLLERQATDRGVAAMAARITAAARDAALVLQPLLGRAAPLEPIPLTECDVVQVLGSVWQRSLDAAVAHGRVTDHLRLEAPPPPGPVVAVPDLVVARILANLLANAIEAMADGGSLKCRIAADGEDIELELQDDGPGLPAAVAADPFAATHGSEKDHGHGIGLAGCRQLAREYGGDLSVAASPEPGAAFRLRLPAALPRLRVLAVDDEPAVREMLGDVLGSEGHDVRLAANAEQARAMFAGTRFDVVLADLRLPGQSGLELAEELRRADATVGIILMTGWGADSALPTAGRQAVDYHAKKPLDVVNLQSLLRSAAGLTVRRRRSKI
jgi:CheY-like chemotaxis protein